MTDKPRTFHCGNCHKDFIVTDRTWTDEKQQAEVARNFPGLRKEEQMQVCDDCFKELVAKHGLWA